jgi:hemerythrin-like metal-binding protein
MRESGFPDLERHHLLHAELARQVDEYLLRYAEGYFTLPTTLSRFLAEWLKQHIRKEDMAFVTWMKAP